MNAEKPDVLPILIHQMRSSLATVRLALQTLLDHQEDPLTNKQRYYLEQAQLRTNRMLFLTDDMMEPAMGAPSVLSITKKPHDLEELVTETLKEFTVRFASKNIDVTRQYGELPTLIELDYEKFKDVVRNLIDNAIKYTPPNGKLVISSTYTDSEAMVSIADTGIGVPPEKTKKLFQKFVRMDNAKFLDQSGVGLGLYIVRRIVEEHGGKLTYQPNEPQGSIFIVSVPK